MFHVPCALSGYFYISTDICNEAKSISAEIVKHVIWIMRCYLTSILCSKFKRQTKPIVDENLEELELSSTADRTIGGTPTLRKMFGDFL